MSTNKIGQRTTDEFMNDYSPVYQPIYPLLMKNAVQHNEVVGDVNFKRASVVGDIRAKHILPKDTEIRQVAVAEGKKNFKKYFLGNQYQVSHQQSQEDTDTVIAEVLDENHKLFDEIMSMGEGTANNNVVNNGLFWSSDPNFITNSTANVSGSGDTQLINLHNAIVAAVSPAKKLAGEKVIFVYGTTVLTALNSLYTATTASFRKTLQDALGSEFTIVEMPDNTYPGGALGFLVVNLDRIKVNYVRLPDVKSSGSNEENGYNWVNFLMGSVMIDVNASGGIIKQTLTFS